jgi:CBS domain-containing protein
MDVARLCQRNVVTINPFDDLAVAAETMRKHHVGYLIVVEPMLAEGGMRPMGVLTDRDIVIAVVAKDADPRVLRVGDVMTREPVTARDADTVDSALAEMRRIGVRRLPVVDGLGRLVGVLALDDVLGSLADQLGQLTASIRNERRIEGVMRP